MTSRATNQKRLLPRAPMGQLNGHEPLVFRGPMLSLSSVRKLGGRASVVVKDQQHASFGRTTFAELVDGVRDERLVWYFAQQPVPPAVAPALPGCPVGRQPGLRQPNMWVGSAGAHTPLHHDYMHNVAMQLDGRKRFTLFAPSDTPYLARETNDARRVNYSQITRPRRRNSRRSLAVSWASLLRTRPTNNRRGLSRAGTERCRPLFLPLNERAGGVN